MGREAEIAVSELLQVHFLVVAVICVRISQRFRHALGRHTTHRKLVLISLCSALVSGCTIHPLPNDVTGLSTYNIVRQIRCETREAVIDSILDFLTNEGNHEGGKVDDASRAVGLKFQAEYRANPQSISNFDPKLLSGFARTVVSVLWNTGIAYNYDLEMIEVNNIDPEVNLLRALPTRSEMLGLKGQFDRHRQNIRTFTVTDNFGGLVKNVKANYCTNFIVEANIIYPIAGKVGMERLVHDFLVLTLFGNLSATSKDIPPAKGPPTLVDQLEFQTVIGGTATPKVTFIQLGTALHVADATLGLTASRTDTHKLTVGLYLAPPGASEIAQARTGIFQGSTIVSVGRGPGGTGPDVFRTLITAKGGTAEQGAAAAVEQFLTQRLFQPKIVVQP